MLSALVLLAIQTMFVLLHSVEVTESLICGTGEEWGRGRGSHITRMLITSHLGKKLQVSVNISSQTGIA